MTKGMLMFVILVLAIALGSWFLIPESKSVQPPLTRLESISTMQPITELKIEDTVVGTGAEVKPGDTVVMHYTGTLISGIKFDSSLDRGQPFETQIGVGRVIQGWDKGVPGMKVGGKRKLYIPSSMAYGERGAGGVIAPNSDLIFTVELLAIK
ncbi:MAG: FKBP-type peptidyl-prolyl cis-trans isomerase [Patescibacteria group bacterium]